MITHDNSTWIQNQFGDCDLGDKRRSQRLTKVAAHMLACPEKSLPSQNRRWSDLKAAYRLFNCPGVTFEAVAAQHWIQTRQTKPGRFLLIGDTTDIDHSFHQGIAGLGILGDGRGRGMQLHNCLMYDCGQKQIVGSAGGLIHYRQRTPKNETRRQRLERERESEIWGRVVDSVGMAPAGSQWIHVFDRGGDDFETMCHIRLKGCDWIIRAAKLTRKINTSDGRSLSLQESLDDARLLGRYELNLRSRPGVKARTAKIEVSTISVTFPRPKHHSQWVKQCGIKELPMNVVVVQEVDAPNGVTPICWILLTSLPTGTFEDALQVIEDYENRWLIEEYHKVLKTGCNLEVHALRTSDRLEPLVGLISVIGVRLFQMKLIGRNQPSVQASTHVPSSWLRCLALVETKLEVATITVYTFFREIAKLGGFLARKGDGEPGWQTVWRGYQTLQSLLDGMRLAGAV
jgi:hypothetical protein